MPSPPTALEIPHLNLAVDGFSASQVATLTLWLEEEAVKYTETADVVWALSSLHDADAVLHAFDVSGTTDAVRPQKALPSVVLWHSLKEQEDQAQSLHVAKHYFLMALMELNGDVQESCVSYTLASLLVERHQARDPMSGLWHVHSKETLLAVVDFERLNIAIRRETHFLELENAAWVHRSEQAVAPPGFALQSIEQLMWHYTRRTQRMVLPRRYSKCPIHLRRLPRLPLALMGEQAFVAVALLRSKSMSLRELAACMVLPVPQVSKILATLHYASAITTRPRSLWARLKATCRPQASNPFGETTRVSSAGASPVLPEGRGIYGLTGDTRLIR
jgi:hypothetical protein